MVPRSSSCTSSVKKGASPGRAHAAPWVKLFPSGENSDSVLRSVPRNLHEQAQPALDFFVDQVHGQASEAHRELGEEALESSALVGGHGHRSGPLCEQIFATQKRLGVVPENAQLTAWPDALPKWETLSADEKKLFARQAEVFAGYTAYTDHEIGRVIQAVENMGKLDNTLIIYIVGDNGTSPEGTLLGTPKQYNAVSRARD